MSWVWRESNAKGPALLILLAIADHAADDGSNAYPAMSTLAAKARVSERTAQRCVSQLVDMGELEVRRCEGKHRTNVYRLPMRSTPPASHPVIPSPRQADTPTPVSPPRVTDRRERVSQQAKEGDNCVTQTVLKPSLEPSVEPSAARARGIDTQTVVELAAFFTESVPISNTSRTRSVIAKALGAGFSAERIRTALVTLIAEGRGCTEDQLRIALQGARAPTSTTNTKVAQGLALAARLRQTEQKAIQP